MNLITAARLHTGLTQLEFGKMLGQLVRGRPITQCRISDYESGRVAPSPKVRAVAIRFAARELIEQLNNQPETNWLELVKEYMN